MNPRPFEPQPVDETPSRRIAASRATRLANRVWSLTVEARNRLKRAGVLGPLDGLTTYLGPRLIPPPSVESEVSLQLGLELLVPPRSPSYRNFATGVYETDVTALLLRNLSHGMTVIDLGASIGYYSLLSS